MMVICRRRCQSNLWIYCSFLWKFNSDGSSCSDEKFSYIEITRMWTCSTNATDRFVSILACTKSLSLERKMSINDQKYSSIIQTSNARTIQSRRRYILLFILSTIVPLSEFYTLAILIYIQRCFSCDMTIGREKTNTIWRSLAILLILFFLCSNGYRRSQIFQSNKTRFSLLNKVFGDMKSTIIICFTFLDFRYFQTNNWKRY